MTLFSSLKKVTIVVFLCYVGMFSLTLSHIYHMAEHGMHSEEHCMFGIDDVSLCTKQTVRNLVTPVLPSQKQLFLFAFIFLSYSLFFVFYIRQKVSYIFSPNAISLYLYRELFSSGVLHPKAP